MRAILHRCLSPFLRLYGLLYPDRRRILIYALILLLSKARLSALPADMFLAVCICLVGLMIRKSGGRLWGTTLQSGWHAVCHVVIYFIFGLQFYLTNTFGLNFVGALSLLLQTNTTEAAEFVRSYLFSIDLLLVIAIVAIVGGVEYLVCRKQRLHFARFLTTTRFKQGSALRALLTKSSSALMHRRALGLFFALTLPWGGYLTAKNITVFFTYDDPSKAYDAVNRSGNAFYDLAFAFWQQRVNANNQKQCKECIADTRVTRPTDYRGHVVLIIGESHIKSHSSLYGYGKPTNPHMERLRAAGQLFVFSNAIAPSNSTHEVLQEMLSVTSVTDSLRWSQVTLFPAVFKAAGWNVVLCSNQFNDQPSASLCDVAITGVINAPEVSSACFTTRNHSTFPFDGEMIDSFITHRRIGLLSARPTLSVVHLMGQHIRYSSRYPEAFARFTAAHYADRTGLSERQKSDVAAYDNATLYNDLQLYRLMESYKDDDAVVVYVGDHGDEVHDYRNHVGRAHDLRAYGAPAYHQQHDVPLLIYTTTRYRHLHPERVAEIKAALHRPMMTDDLCQLLFHLGQVHTAWYDSTRCVASPHYQPRPRILLSGDNYDRAVSRPAR